MIPHDPTNAHLHDEIGRNSFENPGLILTDVALEKGFDLGFERFRIVLRAEVQDIANHNNVNILNSAVTNIGLSTYMNTKNATQDAGRTMALWAKITF